MKVKNKQLTIDTVENGFIISVRDTHSGMTTKYVASNSDELAKTIKDITRCYENQKESDK